MKRKDTLRTIVLLSYVYMKKKIFRGGGGGGGEGLGVAMGLSPNGSFKKKSVLVLFAFYIIFKETKNV